MLVFLALLAAQPVPDGPSLILEYTDEVGWMVDDRAGKPLHWDPEDLPVTVTSHTSLKAAFPWMKVAVEVWNRAAGCTVFLLTEPMEDMDALAHYVAVPQGVVPILPTLEEDADASIGAYPTGRIARAAAWIPMGENNPDVLLIMLIHELGHVLGLDHDTLIVSVMYKTIHKSYANYMRVTYEDRERVRKRYCSNLLAVPESANPRSSPPPPSE